MMRTICCLVTLAFASCSSTAMRPVPASSPIVIAHRGASAVAPENTLVAYERAIEQGARLAECDVYLSSDGVPFLFHDSELERTTNASGPVTERSLVDLKQLDAGSWKGPEFAGERIPTLVEFLEAVKGKLRPVIEIKGKDREIEQAVINALHEARFPSEDAMIFSFHYKVVAEIARLDPSLPTTWLVTPPEPGEDLGPFFRAALKARVSALGVSHDEVTLPFLQRAHETGFPVFVWTVNDAARIRELTAMGVDGIISDRPAMALGVLGRNTGN